MRELTSKIYVIIFDIKSFFAILFIFVGAYANIFYVTRFYDDTHKEHNYLWYVMYTFDMFFGNWEYATPTSNIYYWVYIIWFSFALLFTIVMFNVLIAFVEKSFQKT